MAVILGLESLSEKELRALIQKAPKVTLRSLGCKATGLLISYDQVTYHLAVEEKEGFTIAVYPVAQSWLLYHDGIKVG